MTSGKPHVVVFYGGTSGNHDLSQESALWLCEHAPRSEYQITPVEITTEGLWKVPLGSLPVSGKISRMMSMLSQAVRAQEPTSAMQRLLNRPVQAFMSLIRGEGGDDGATHGIGQMLKTPVVGSSLTASQNTSNKYAFHHIISHLTASPHTRYMRSSTPEAEILRTVDDSFMFPLFIKPATQEGSRGIEHVPSVNEILPALRRARSHGDVIIQEQQIGQELSVTVLQGHDGRLYTLPSTLIIPRKAAFYDDMAKRRLGRATLHTAKTPENRIIAEAESIAKDVFQELGCEGVATVDMINGDEGIYVLEVNTVPMFTQFTPLIYQLKAAGLHPGTLFDGLVKQTLNR